MSFLTMRFILIVDGRVRVTSSREPRRIYCGAVAVVGLSAENPLSAPGPGTVAVAGLGQPPFQPLHYPPTQ